MGIGKEEERKGKKNRRERDRERQRERDRESWSLVNQMCGVERIMGEQGFLVFFLLLKREEKAKLK